MPQTNKKKRTAHIDFMVFIFPILITLACAVLYKTFQPTYNAFAASALAYGIKIFYTVLTLICSFLCLFISIGLYKKKLYFCSITYSIFFIALFFLFLELIHYGQKIYSPHSSPTPMALHELFQIRSLFDVAFFFLGFYSSFYWIRFIKASKDIKSYPARLFTPDFSLIFYFLPIVVFFIIANCLEYVTYSAVRTNFTSVIANNAWLFDLNRFFPHYSRLLLSIGLFIFFLGNTLWIRHTGTIQKVSFQLNIKKLTIVSCVLVFGALFGNKLVPQLADLGWGKHFEINNDLNGAFYHYNESIKKNDNVYAHKALFLLYQRLGDDDSAIKHLSRAIQQSIASGNQEMTTELYKTALSFYPNSTIDPETRVIYFQK